MTSLAADGAFTTAKRQQARERLSADWRRRIVQIGVGANGARDDVWQDGA